jgi:signal transduction histidine kinase
LTFMIKRAKKRLARIASPVSKDEDKARSEFILNVLLMACIGLSSVAFMVNATRKLLHLNDSVSITAIFFVLCFFLFLYILSRKGFCRGASHCLIAVFFLLVTYEIYMWGADLPSALLSYVLIIVMAGVLVSTRFAFITTLVVSAAIAVVSYLQIGHIIASDTYWKKEPIITADFIVFIVIFLIIATVSWLSNREIERSLIRARRSEAALKKERDSLEVTVEEKTRELKEAQAEKMAQLYRFAEFGRLSSGLFHDLINPLSAVSLNMEKIKNDKQNVHLDQAVLAAKKMDELVVAVRKQLSREETNSHFSIQAEIRQVIHILAHKAEKRKVKIEFLEHEQAGDTTLFGEATKFHHAVQNLISNAIDAYSGMAALPKSKCFLVNITLKKENGKVIISVRDSGSGIPPEDLKKIFEPFYTTKANTEGTGIGLSITKRIIEKDFHGSIEVESKSGTGSVFEIRLPILQALHTL